MPIMFIGTKKITKCGDCPGYEWAGESIGYGNRGYNCEFGAYSHDYTPNKNIPKNCPLTPLNNLSMVRAELIKENCDGCLNMDINDNKDNHCYIHKTMVINCEDKYII